MRARFSIIAALALAAALFLPSCESTDFTAPDDSEIFVSANPASIALDPLDPVNPTSEATTTISAQVVAANGTPVSGAAVSFSSTGGSLASKGQSIETNGNGVATDSLTVRETDTSPVTVTARSGSVSQTVEVDLNVAGVNERPTVTLTALPADRQQANSVVTFLATPDDDDGDPIGCYEWTLGSGLAALDPCSFNARDATSNPNRVQADTMTCVFPSAQQLAVQVRASDSTDCTAPTFGPPDILNYEICSSATPAPNAVASVPQTATLAGSPLRAQVTVDAGGSTDPSGVISAYSWNCGNGESLKVTSVALCTYSTAGPFTVTLTVTNPCGRQDTDTKSITVSNPVN